MLHAGEPKILYISTVSGAQATALCQQTGTTHVVFEPLDFEDAGVIGKILAHLERQHPSVTTVPPLPARGPPRQGVLELS